MSRGLKAIQEFKSQQQGVNVYANDYLDIIEQELKEKEKQDNYIKTLEDRIDNIETSYLRDRKALEIIENKEINIHSLLLHLKRFDSPDGYNALVGAKYQITQEEWNLLEEVLL